MEEVYGQNLVTFAAEESITRYIYQANLNLQLTISEAGGPLQKLGEKGPTSHLIQLESFLNRETSMEEVYLTDFDDFMKGNYFFRSSALS